jgi:predicted unusual protein kinase regulating ubiquinone biosynthesis (AarF/ABC1/UbiB family)
MMAIDSERNRFSARAARYARVGAQMGGVAARMGAAQLFGAGDAPASAAALRAALGGLKGPLMKVAQLMATIPDLLPPEFAEELQKLQSDAPPMGAAFVKRRMQAELGPDWRARFADFDLHPTAAASLGQVHRATALDGQRLACKLQYPDMSSAVEADISQLQMLFKLHRQFNPVIDTQEAAREIAERVREELEYKRESKHAALYALMLKGADTVRVPGIRNELSTNRLLTMQWLDGRKILDFKQSDQETRNRLAVAMFRAWWHPFSQFGVIHGDPHLGNYTVFEEDGAAAGINLLDYGCVRIFPPRFVQGVVDLYEGLRTNDEARIVHAYETWGFKGLRGDVIEILNIWARFIYGPILDDRVRTVANGVPPGQYGRREMMQVHAALKDKGPVRIPKEFVFMDRAAIGLGAVFLHLDAKLNFYQLFHEAFGGSALSADAIAGRQSQALAAVGLG